MMPRARPRRFPSPTLTMPPPTTAWGETQATAGPPHPIQLSTSSPPRAASTAPPRALPYAFRGAIWYQGESNALRAHQYRKLLPALIESWRAGSRQPDMDFLIVQLPNHGATPPEPADSAWAETREVEFLTIKTLPHV